MKKKPIDWITVKGNHVPIQKGQTKKEAVSKFFDDKRMDKQALFGGAGSEKDIIIPKSLGASAKNYPVKLPDSRQHTKLAEGQTIKGKVFAGKGTKTPIRERFRLEIDYKISADEWMKVGGKGYAIDNGKKRLAELHWYEAKGEKYNIKVSRWLE